MYRTELDHRISKSAALKLGPLSACKNPNMYIDAAVETAPDPEDEDSAELLEDLPATASPVKNSNELHYG